LYEILCKRNVVKGMFRGTRHGEGIALFYGRKSNDIDTSAVKLYGRLQATPLVTSVCSVTEHSICSPVLVALDLKGLPLFCQLNTSFVFCN